MQRDFSDTRLYDSETLTFPTPLGPKTLVREF